MPNSFVTQYFQADHERLDILYSAFKQRFENDNADYQSYFNLFKQGLEKHIQWEEQLLFPEFEQRSGMTSGGPTFVMRHEHAVIKQLLDNIQQHTENKTAVIEHCSQLENVLNAHNHKEENILYPAIDNLLSGDDVQSLCLALI